MAFERDLCCLKWFIVVVGTLIMPIQNRIRDRSEVLGTVSQKANLLSQIGQIV
jgi:hypothetical protein